MVPTEKWAVVVVDATTVRQYSKLRGDVERWCYDVLKGNWVSIYTFFAEDEDERFKLRVEFELEEDATLFMLTWIG